VRWGAGQTGTLLLSDYSRPLDQLYADFQYRWLQYSFLTATLNPMSDVVGVNRFLTAHRLDLRLRHNLWVSLNEAVVYGGAGKTAPFAFINPVIFYHGEVLNGPTDGNTLGSIDFAYYPVRNLNFYGELLIDDIQLEKSGPGDLEPSEWGLLLGAQTACGRILLQAEYVRITNRTYKTPQYWEIYTHRNDPIGYYLGNDFDHLWLRGNYWLNSALRLQVVSQFIRRGEGRIDTPFDTPWSNTPLGQNYSEPFPTGTVETTRRLQLELRWQPWDLGFAEMVLGNEQVKNVNNVAGKKIEGWYADIKFWLEIGKVWEI